jgi:hypothetical protein
MSGRDEDHSPVLGVPVPALTYSTNFGSCRLCGCRPQVRRDISYCFPQRKTLCQPGRGMLAALTGNARAKNFVD